MEIVVYCTHTEPEIEKNIECKQLINESDLGYSFKCPLCKREIFLEVK